MSALRTDLYELTMMGGYFHQGRHRDRVTFELFVRELPPHRRYLVFAGLDRIVDYLDDLRFHEDQIAHLRDVPAMRPAMSEAFADYLRSFRFTGDAWAMPEGTVFFAGEPVLRVTAPLPEAQLVETFLLSIVNTEVLVCSKAARIVEAAGDAPVMEFGTRRTSPDEALRSARAAYLAGFAATSNVEAGRRYGIPVSGTAAHSWTLAFPSEEEAFAAQFALYGRDAVLLVDTFDTRQGVRNAIAVAGDRLGGIRLDSGDLDTLAFEARALLDEAGLRSTRIVASGDLDEYEIARLRGAGAPVDAWGVGTRLVRSTDAPHVGGVYKLVQHDALGEPRMKTSPGKGTRPGAHQVHRVRSGRKAVRDIVALADETVDGAEPLLVPIFDAGRLVRPPDDLEAARARARDEIATLPSEVRAIGNRDRDEGSPYPVQVSERLRALMAGIRSEVSPT